MSRRSSARWPARLNFARQSWGAAADAKLHARGVRAQSARETRHGFLQDVVKSIVIWTLCCLLQCSLVWALAHFSVSLQLPKWMSGSGWLLLGSCPVLGAERLLQRSAAGVKLRGISGDGPMKEVPSRCFPAIILLPALPGAPWFGPRRVRLLLALMAGMLLTALDRCLSPFAAVIGGCLETLLLLLRAGFASIWICDWRLQELWRKKT
ncbi:unnamed protein product [Durusdinium trenchii]|uniref:Uncharacterized protein n=1 Tax=Durusdinium trenchii TaxID=1381693 RepID=A0ABP0N9Y0_9DINO